MHIKKAVFPVAGMGTRFLPATKASPKEMLPVVDKPLIQYAVKEAVEAGITQLIFVTNRTHGKRAIEDHFDANFELEAKLAKSGKLNLLEIVSDILPKGVSCAYIRQSDAFGLGHAVLCAKPLIQNEPFAVLLADDLIEHEHQGCLSQMMEVYNQDASSIVAVQPISSAETHLYGVVGFDGESEKLKKITHIVEKPPVEKAPSRLGVVGRYILTPAIFNCLENLELGDGEMQLTDAIQELLHHEKVLAFQFDGIRHDCGNKLGYLKATVSQALKHPELAEDFRVYLREVAAQF